MLGDYPKQLKPELHQLKKVDARQEFSCQVKRRMTPATRLVYQDCVKSTYVCSRKISLNDNL